MYRSRVSQVHLQLDLSQRAGAQTCCPETVFQEDGEEFKAGCHRRECLLSDTIDISDRCLKIFDIPEASENIFTHNISIWKSFTRLIHYLYENIQINFERM